MIAVCYAGKMSVNNQRVNKYKPRNVNRTAGRGNRVPVMTTTENVTRWIVDQEFRETQDQIGMPLGRFVTHNVFRSLMCSMPPFGFIASANLHNFGTHQVRKFWWSMDIMYRNRVVPICQAPKLMYFLF